MLCVIIFVGKYFHYFVEPLNKIERPTVILRYIVILEKFFASAYLQEYTNFSDNRYATPTRHTPTN